MKKLLLAFSLAMSAVFSSATMALAVATLTASPNPLVVGQKATITASYAVPPLTGEGHCEGPREPTKICPYVTKFWFRRNGSPYKEAKIVSTSGNTLTVIVPDIPEGSSYAVSFEHTFTGSNIYELIGLGPSTLKVIRPAQPSPKPTVSPSPSPSVSVQESATPAASPEVSATPSVAPSSTPESTPAAEVAAPKNFWQKITFPVQRWWKGLFGKK